VFTSSVQRQTAPFLLLCLMSCASWASFARAQQDHTATPVTAPGATPSGAGSSGDPAAPLPPAACLERLDAAVELAERGDTGRARLRLERLAPRCAHLPQIHHDLGVIAARDGRVSAALDHFETAVAADPRAAMTLDHLRTLHRREAAAAYARALGSPSDTSRPAFTFQRSDDVGADTLRAAASEEEPLRDVATIEYELYAWWRSAVDGDVRERRSHYVDDYPRALALLGRERDAALRWEDVRREIAFTTEDAVAVLTYAGRAADGDGKPADELDGGAAARVDGGDDAERTGAFRRLLLLRLQDRRWLIYRDTPL